MLREEILGFDTIFHVVRMGRLEENDKKLPRLVFETLMNAKERPGRATQAIPPVGHTLRFLG
jgi:hypothetical protein